MNLYLKNILPRVAQYSKDLSRKELFVDQPWVIVDDAGNHQKYIFERNGRLIISNNGNVSFGTWEYLSTAKSLLLVTENEKLLLNQGFIDSPVMILKRDGVSSEEVLLANENLLPDLDIEGYFRMLFIESNKITIHETITGHQIEIHGTMGSTYERLLYLQKLITIDGEDISDTYIEMKDNDQILQIQNSHVVKYPPDQLHLPISFEVF